MVFVRAETDEGITGPGKTYRAAGLVHKAKPVLIGEVSMTTGAHVTIRRAREEAHDRG